MESRVKNTTRNIFTGLIQQCLNILLPFIVRTLILYKLGKLYQGLDGLFVSILQILSLSELGLSTAVVYMLYQPIADRNYTLVVSIMNYLKKLYRIIGGIILIVGLIISLFLPVLIKGEYPKDINIYILFYVYLINTSISYWLFAYKSVFFTAIQRIDIVNKISILTQVTMKLLQIIVLMIFSNYYAYIAILPIMTICNNLLMEWTFRKNYRNYISNNDIVTNSFIPQKIKIELLKQVKGIFVNRLSDVTRNGIDNIILSAFLGLATVAVYNNYLYIYTAIYGVTLVISNSMGASVGNSIVRESINKNYNDMNKFNFIFSWIIGVCVSCLACLYQPFMRLWMNNNDAMLLPMKDVYLFVIYFYVITMTNIRNQYLNGFGLFWRLRFYSVFEMIFNVFFNVILGYFFGVTGILTATILTIFVINYVLRNRILFKECFYKSSKNFYINQAIYLGITLVVVVINIYICNHIIGNSIFYLIIRLVVCVIVTNTIFWLFYTKFLIFKESKNFILDIVKIKFLYK